jgi:hypothetical protein
MQTRTANSLTREEPEESYFGLSGVSLSLSLSIRQVPSIFTPIVTYLGGGGGYYDVILTDCLLFLKLVPTFMLASFGNNTA